MTHDVNIWINDGWVCFIIPIGGKISFSTGGKTDEGYHSTNSMIWHDEDTNTIFLNEDNDNYDCDGRHSSKWLGTCHVDNLFDGERDGVSVPEWDTAESEQRDYFAEAMNY